MDNVFKQPKRIDKIIFDTYYKHIEKFEAILPEDIAGLSFHEIQSDSIDPEPHDIWRIVIFVGDEFEASDIMELIQNFVSNSDMDGVSELKCEKVEDKDWVLEYQKQQKPLMVEDFYISNQDLIVKCPKGKVPICIDSSKAFGTGEHETTSGCIKMLKNCSKMDIKTVLDIGTGSGILSFVAEKIWPNAEIIGSDLDASSVEVAKHNKKYNKSKVNFYTNNKAGEIDLPAEYSAGKDNTKFDVIVSNILLQPLIDLAPSIRRHVHNDSVVILSGFLDYQLQELVDVYIDNKFEIVKKISRNKWLTILLKVNSD